MLTEKNIEQVSHVARLAVLATFARGVAAAEFASTPEVGTVHLSVCRDPAGGDFTVDLEFMDNRGHIFGGMSL